MALTRSMTWACKVVRTVPRPSARAESNRFCTPGKVEAAATPLTYWAVAYLKRTEGLDAYDRGVSFNPVALTR